MVLLAAALAALPALGAEPAPRNVIVILSDDHRYDFLGFHDRAPAFLATPQLDRLASQGAHLRNAFVTTALCSPSRASILTGQYAHRHGVVDNATPIPAGTRFFPQDLQTNGYRTACIGKWHMGEADDRPQPGFHRWVSFRGQGVYRDPVLNVDGQRVERTGYITDLLTDYALDWLEEQRRAGAPFFLYLSHKAVHAEFTPAERHAQRYAGLPLPYPPSMADTEANVRGKPRWVRAQRDSWHGVDFAYHGAMDFDVFYRGYAETLLAVDESVGRVLDFLEANGLADNTLVLYLGDNGFLLGEHGLIDKRNAYEPSIRIPMLAWAPGLIAPGTVVDTVVRNLDVAPTVLELTATRSSTAMDGISFLGELTGRPASTATGDREFLYEYYWEYAFPHTPTTFALRGERYKFIYYHGVWDTNELYDLATDPDERHNLIHVPAMRDVATSMRERLFDRLEEADAMAVPLRRGTWQAAERRLRGAGE